MTGRTEGTLRVLYLGVLTLLVLEQFVLRVPPRAYLDVTLLFGAITVGYGLSRATTALRTGGRLYDVVVSVLPVALVAAAVATVIAVTSDVETVPGAVAAGGLTLVLLLVGIPAGAHAAAGRRRRGTSGSD